MAYDGCKSTASPPKILRLDAPQFRLRINSELSELNIYHLHACLVLALWYALWYAHWQFVFDDRPFYPKLVAEKAIAHIDRLARETYSEISIDIFAILVLSFNRTGADFLLHLNRHHTKRRIRLGPKMRIVLYYY